MSLRQNKYNPYQTGHGFSYQSECHCAKTLPLHRTDQCCLVTSQNVTAPKLICLRCSRSDSLVTSQNVTAPKQDERLNKYPRRLVTSQNVTAPKRQLDNNNQ